MSTLERIQTQVVAELEGWRDDFLPALTEREGAESASAIFDEARAQLLHITSSVPDPGWTAPHMRAFTIGGAIYVAVHLALRPRGYDAKRTWELCEQATRSHFARMSPRQKKLASDGMFSWPMKALSRWIAKRSRKEPVGGWAFEFVEAGEGFDYGVNYTRCAIRELAVAHGAADLAPYICLADVPGSEAFGWGLTRTETLAQGGSRCDFRFRRGGETRVTVRLPVVD